MKLGKLLLLICLVAALFSCSTETKIDASLEDVGYYIRNTPSDWWSSSSSTKPALTYFFALVFDGSLSSSDIVSARVYLPESTTRYWELDADSFDKTSNTLSQSGFWYTDNCYELPVGEMKAEVVLADGTTKEQTFMMGIPGNISNDDKSYVYSSDDETPTYSSVSVMALKRPTISSATATSSEIAISFTINDSNVNNGRIYFFDANGDYIGCTSYFRDKTSGEGLSYLNTGSGFNHQEDDENQIILTNTSVFDSDGNTLSSDVFSTISKCRLCVIDGEQYEDSISYSAYDYISYSELTDIDS